MALLAGMAGGLARMGWSVGSLAGGALHHGPLMVVGFLGTLIGVERAVALGRPWAFAAPLVTGLGALALLVSGSVAVAGPVLAAGSWLLLLVVIRAARGRREAGLVYQGLGAGSLAVATTAWAAGVPVPSVVPGWTSFLLLTIAGERLELSRVAQPPVLALRAFSVVAGVLLLAPALFPAAPAPAARALGAAWLAAALWLGRFDLARRSVRRPGLPRFMAASLLGGYAWLGVAGALLLAFGLPPAGLHYDAVLHAFLLGFVFALIFGHAPVVFPAVLGMAIPFRSRFYAHLALLHLGVAIRLVGDLGAGPSWRSLGGLLNVLAVVAFFLSTAAAAVGGLRAARKGAGPGPSAEV